MKSEINGARVVVNGSLDMKSEINVAKVFSRICPTHIRSHNCS